MFSLYFAALQHTLKKTNFHTFWACCEIKTTTIIGIGLYYSNEANARLQYADLAADVEQQR